MRFLADRQTATYGINAPYLGPAIRVRRGEKVVAQVSNNVPETITMHWHGLIIPGAADGGPHQLIPPGKQWQTELAVDQPAATLWFHPHSYPATAQEVITDANHDRTLSLSLVEEKIVIIDLDPRTPRDGDLVDH